MGNALSERLARHRRQLRATIRSVASARDNHDQQVIVIDSEFGEDFSVRQVTGRIGQRDRGLEATPRRELGNACEDFLALCGSLSHGGGEALLRRSRRAASGFGSARS